VTELKIKVGTAESLLSAAHRLSEKSTMSACRDVLAETGKVIESMKPLLDTVDRIGNALRLQVEAARRTPSVSAVSDLHIRK